MKYKTAECHTPAFLSVAPRGPATPPPLTPKQSENEDSASTIIFIYITQLLDLCKGTACVCTERD